MKNLIIMAFLMAMSIVPIIQEPEEFASVGAVQIVQGSEDDLEAEEYCDSLEMLAVCVEAEAGNQGLYGKRLVADVILNRVDSETFPDDIVSVISQKNQFATYTDGAMDRVTEPSEETIKAVQMELEHRTDPEILFFTAEGYNPYCKPAYRYKDHYFGYLRR